MNILWWIQTFETPHEPNLICLFHLVKATQYRQLSANFLLIFAFLYLDNMIDLIVGVLMPLYTH